MKIINQEFHTGERYKGMKNGVILLVADIKRKGEEVMTPYGFIRVFEHDTVTFRDEQSGKQYPVQLKTAQCLLLEKVC